MKLKIYFVIVFISFLIPVYAISTVNKDYQYIKYKVTSCKPHESGIAFWFSTEDKKNTRHFAVARNDQALIISFSGGKGIIKWQYVQKIIYKELNGEGGYITVEFDKPYSFMGWEKYKQLEFGVMSAECWRKLKEAVGSDIKTEFITMSDS